MFQSAAARNSAPRFGGWPCRRHRPEQTLLYQIVEQHYPAVTVHLAAQAGYLFDHVQREFEDYLNVAVWNTLPAGALRNLPRRTPNSVQLQKSIEFSVSVAVSVRQPTRDNGQVLGIICCVIGTPSLRRGLTHKTAITPLKFSVHTNQLFSYVARAL